MPKTVSVDKNTLIELINKVKSGEMTLEQYQNTLLNFTKKEEEEEEKPIIKIEKRDIEDINNQAHERKKKIKSWKKDNPGSTELEKINNNQSLIEEKIKALLDKGALEIKNPKYTDIENAKEQLGKRLLISYILKDGKYRSGGFLTANSDYYFVLLGGQIDNKISFSIQYMNVDTIYIRKVNKKNATKPIKPVPTLHLKTRFPVKIDDIVVYYAKDNFDRRRFMDTQKYSNMKNYHSKNLA